MLSRISLGYMWIHRGRHRRWLEQLTRPVSADSGKWGGGRGEGREEGQIRGDEGRNGKGEDVKDRNGKNRDDR